MTASYAAERSPPPWRDWVMLAVAGMTPVVAYVGNQAFAPLIALAGIACLPGALAHPRPNAGMGILLGLVVWALVSLQWTVHPISPADFARPNALESITALKLVLQLALYGAFVVCMAELSPGAGERAMLVFGCGLALLAVLLLAEVVSGAALYQHLRVWYGDPTRPDLARRDVARTAYVMALLFWPVAFALRRRGWTWMGGLILAGLAATAASFNVNTPLVALAVSGLVVLLVGRFGRIGLIAWIVGVVIYFLAAPWLVHWIAPYDPLHTTNGEIGKLSWAARMDIWSFASQRIFERPALGWGLDASRAFPAIPLHTHDLAIQLWLELGAVGATLGALFFIWLAGAIDRLEARDRWAAAAAAGSASAYLTIGALSFGAWQEWWLALGALAVAACSALAASRGTAAPSAA